MLEPFSEEQALRFRRVCYALLITVSAGVMLAGIVHAPPLGSANDRSRWATVYALVHEGRFRIDEVIRRRGWDTIDKVRHEGHFYSTKPALLPTMVAGVYWAVWRTTGFNLADHTDQAANIVLVIVNLLPMLAALIVLSRYVERYARSPFTRMAVMTTAAFGTFLTTFVSTFNNHTVAAVAVVLAIWPVTRIVADGSRAPGHFAAAGFFAAFACVNELPAALFGLAVFGVLAWADWRRTLWYFAPAALVPLAAFFYTTYLQTGGWKPFYMYYGTEKYRYVYQGVPSYWMDPKGLDRNLDGTWTYLLHCTVGHHGILSLSPIFLLSLAGWCLVGQWKGSPLRALLWTGLGLTAAVLLFYLSRTENYNYGGVTSGLRWTFWLIPFWLVAMIPVLDAWGDRRALRVLTAVCLGVSVFSAMYAIHRPWQHPWLFVWMQERGWIDYSEPQPALERPLGSWIAELPEADPGGPRGVWIEFAGLNPDGSLTRLRVTDRSRSVAAGRRLRRVDVTRNPGRPSAQQKTIFIDEQQFQRGAPPEEFLRWPESEPDAERKAVEAAYLRGLPAPGGGFVARGVQYVHSPLRDDAFRTMQATAWAVFSPVGRAEAARGTLAARCDVWLSDEVPFGTLQFETTISTRRGEVLTRQRWTAVATGTE